MAQAALYFPYIEVPESPSLARVLLYWEELGSIIPEGFGPADYGTRTRELVDARLVRPVDPQAHWHELDDFVNDFLLLVDAERPSGGFTAPTLIHRDKAAWGLWDELTQRGLAKDSGEWDWVSVDGRVAALFMAYLAGRLSRVPELDMEPITDQREYFRGTAPNDLPQDTSRLFDRMRGAILRDVLPAPTHPIPAWELANFKEQHWEQLGSFRRFVESGLLECARERDEDLRRRMLAQLRDNVADGVDEIAGRLRERRWEPGVGLLCVVIAGAPAVAETLITGNPFPASGAASVPLAEIVRRALSGGRARIVDEPLAYAALAREAFAG